MNHSLSTPLDIRKFLTGHVVDVFGTMLSLSAVPVAGDVIPSFPERITGSVGFGGEKLNGAVYLHLSSPFASTATGIILGCTPADLGEVETNDVIGELTNMLAGGLKSALCDHGLPCAVSTPAIIRGAYEIETVPDVCRELLLFEADKNRFAVEIHVKFNPA